MDITIPWVNLTVEVGMNWVPGRNFLQKTTSTLTYCFDWGPWLDGATITGIVVTGESGITVANSSYQASRVYVSVSSPTLAAQKTLSCTITTNAVPFAQTETRTITIEGE